MGSDRDRHCLVAANGIGKNGNRFGYVAPVAKGVMLFSAFLLIQRAEDRDVRARLRRDLPWPCAGGYGLVMRAGFGQGLEGCGQGTGVVCCGDCPLWQSPLYFMVATP